jgi:hypothetical protein
LILFYFIFLYEGVLVCEKKNKKHKKNRMPFKKKCAPPPKAPHRCSADAHVSNLISSLRKYPPLPLPGGFLEKTTQTRLKSAEITLQDNGVAAL